MGKLVRSISGNGGVIVVVLDSTDIVAKAHECHDTSATASAALGRMLTAAGLMGAMLKGEDDSLTVRINGGGPIGDVVAVSDSKGNVKGYCANPHADLPHKEENGKLDVSGVVGKDGFLFVITDMGLKEPYIGQVPITSGEIAEDITYYYAVSQQTPTVCALGVLVDTDLSIKRAGGFLLQLMPGATDAEIDLIEKNIADMGSVTKMLENMSVEEIAFKALDGFDSEILDESQVAFNCSCSRERTERNLISLGKKELDEMADEGKDIEVLCNFCNTKYVFTPQQLRDLSDSIPAQSGPPEE